MSLSPQKKFTPRKRTATITTTQSQFSTPKTIKSYQISTNTPECFTKVHLETPKVKPKNSKDKCDEVSNLRVAVRIRPMNASELAIVGSEDIVCVKNNELIVCVSKYNNAINMDHTFQYDHIFWSVDDTSPLYSTQEDVFVTIGVPLLNSAFRGFNACLFAYGQTGSGKSYSMMGRNICDISDIDSEKNSGVTPRFCRELFKRISELEPDSEVSVEVSYFEIYNEKIHDLLSTSSQHTSRVPLKVREHPVLGPYIVDLTTHSVKSYEELRRFLIMGNKNRATAATTMNDFSSRSHSIFTIELGLSKGLDDTDNSRRSRVNLVDLAGSERLNSSLNNDERMKQGVYINKSLLTLGKCISALSDQKKGHFVPYRDSVLTWLLRESLGGNSLTSMLATISPSNTHLEETLSTLRYACQARTIVNRARINESPHDRKVRELKAEIERLLALKKDFESRNSISQSSSFSGVDNTEIEEVRYKLSKTENMLFEAEQIWKKRFMETKETQLKELAEAEKYRAELESRVRVLGTIDDNISVSPYKTNFLKELEGVLTNEETPSSENDLIYEIKMWCNCKGYICTFSIDTVKITNPAKRMQAIINFKNINFKLYGNIIDYLNNLKWIDYSNLEKKLTKPEVISSMNQIYEILSKLQPTDSENSLSLMYAKVNKELLKFETALLNSIKNTKSVSFDVGT